MFIREIILVCYLLCIILGVSGLTIALLTKNRQQSDINRALMWFLVAMLIMCCYDMTIYYCDYVIGGLGSLKILRIGNCIISGTMFFWLSLQKSIVKKETMHLLDTMTKRYIMFYMAMWLLLTCFLDIDHFYTMKWMLLTTDIALIVLVLATAAGYIIFTAVANDKKSLYYMVIVTVMLLWNYISYFWGETSVYWGNSKFIREPVDLTIVFWLIVNASTLLYGYKCNFIHAFTGASEEGNKKNIHDRIDEICMQYRITPREKEFIELIYSGKSNREIAETLFLSESTVKTHIYNIYRKLDVKNRMGVICLINGDSDIGE